MGPVVSPMTDRTHLSRYDFIKELYCDVRKDSRVSETFMYLFQKYLSGWSIPAVVGTRGSALNRTKSLLQEILLRRPRQVMHNRLTLWVNETGVGEPLDNLGWGRDLCSSHPKALVDVGRTSQVGKAREEGGQCRREKPGAQWGTEQVVSYGIQFEGKGSKMPSVGGCADRRSWETSLSRGRLGGLLIDPG